ncbi:PGAP1-like protein-domain-containing protein [Spinellus fusiger]|nr:PGAP1-like protein-domain-containing protein [Spinellus fusiger]
MNNTSLENDTSTVDENKSTSTRLPIDTPLCSPSSSDGRYSPSPDSPSAAPSSPLSHQPCASQPPHPLPENYQLTRSVWIAFGLWVSVFLSVLFITLDSFSHYQRDISDCRESYARPLYIQQTGFDSEMTRFAGKYALYLYREKGIDVSGMLTGVPVLFIPGHAGSYKQMRSIAAEASYYYYQNYARQHDSLEDGVRSLDFFTVDFNEEFSALHGQSLLEQAEYLNDAVDYILKLYPHSRRLGPKINQDLPDPNSVIILGHSMGGVVARAMITLNNYQPGTINTIITLSTPHLLPPVNFDWKISKIYDAIHDAWSREWRGGAATTLNHLQDISLISVAGGTLDNIICSDSANVATFLPSTHGFTVFSTTVPHVWTGTDHISILSCSQFIKILAKTMLECVDARRAAQTKPLEERMSVMKRAFLSGLEERKGDGSDIELGDSILYDIPEALVLILLPGEPLIIKEEWKTKMVLIPIDRDKNPQGGFNVLTDQSVGSMKPVDLHVCTKSEVPSDIVRVRCRSIQSIAVPLPASTYQNAPSSPENTFTFASIYYSEMTDYDFLAVTYKPGSEGFLIAHSIDPQHTHTHVDQSMVSIARHGISLKIDPALVSFVHIPAIESPMLAYHLKFSRPSCKVKTGLFAPFLRQSIFTMHESKFHVNIDEQETVGISLHGRTAFSTVSTSHGKNPHGLTLQFWADPTCPHPIHVDLSIDWYGSAGRIGFRNGVMFSAFAFVIVILVFAAQIRCYNMTGIFPHFGYGLTFCVRHVLPLILVVLALVSYYQPIGSRVFTAFNPTYSPTANYPHNAFDWNAMWKKGTFPMAWHTILLGNTDPFFWWIPLVGLLLSVGLICIVWLLLEVFLWMSAALCSLSMSLWAGSYRLYPRLSETRYQQFQRRAVTTVVLFVLVATCIPYQFVFVVAFLVHIATCIRLKIKTWTAPPAQQCKRMNRYHYMQSILFLLITLLPFNLPILLVWIRNLSVHWFVPFSSDHSVMAIAPFMLYVELLASHHSMLPRCTQRYWHWATFILLYGIVIYAFLYGIKYTHSLYSISNSLICWLLLLHFSDSGYGRLAYHYLMEHLYSFRSKKHS